MNLNILRELDLFGTDIKWRFMSKDNFKSLFGAGITLILAFLFSAKLYLFIDKTSQYGFAQNKINQQFNDDFQFLNMSDIRMVLYSDIEFKLVTHKDETKENIIPRGYFNLSDFIEVSFTELSFLDRKRTPKLIETDCPTNPKFAFIQEYGTTEEQATFKCITFKEEQNTLLIFKNETVLNKANGDYMTLLRGSLPIFGIQFKMKKILVDFLKEYNENFDFILTFVNFKTNPQNFEIESFYSTISIPIGLDFATNAEINFNKLSVSKKFEFDIFDIEFSNQHKFHIFRDSLSILNNPRRYYNSRSKNRLEYVDNLNFKFRVFEDNNEVTFLTLDDILAVLGGFMQIVFTGAQVLAMLYNEKNGAHKIWTHCMNSYHGYDMTIKRVRENILSQMEYCDFHQNKKKEENKEKFYLKESNKKRASHIDNINDTAIEYKRKKDYLDFFHKDKQEICTNCDKIQSKLSINNLISNNENSTKDYRNFNFYKNNSFISKKFGDEKSFSNQKKISSYNDISLVSPYASNQNLIVKNFEQFQISDENKSEKKKYQTEMIAEDINNEYFSNEKNVFRKFSSRKEVSQSNNCLLNRLDDNQLLEKTNEFNNQIAKGKNLNSINNFKKIIENLDIEGIEDRKNNLSNHCGKLSQTNDLSLKKISNSLNLNRNEEKKNNKKAFDLIIQDQIIELKNTNIEMKNFENDIKAVKSNINTNLIDLPNYQIKDAGENSDLKIKEFNLNGNKEELISSIEDKNRNTSTNGRKKKRKGIFISTRKSKFLEKTHDFLELVSIDRYLKLLSGFEAFKFFYFNELNKFNFESFSDLFIFSKNYKFHYTNDDKITVNQQNIQMDESQRLIFEKFLDNLDKY